MAKIDTTPGCGHWAAPAEPVTNYMEWLREQYRTRRDIPQYLIMLARPAAHHRIPPEYVGPYAAEIKAAVLKLAENIHPQQTENSPGQPA